MNRSNPPVGLERDATVAPADGATVAVRAMERLMPCGPRRPPRGALPPEREVTDEPPRVGVFICHCAGEISSVVDVDAVTRQIGGLDQVAFAEHHPRLCDERTQRLLESRIAEHRLNRVVFASCTPRTHEPLFRDLLCAAGLNPYLVELVGIRAQCAWVHPNAPAAATVKAADLVRMAISRVACAVALADRRVKVSRSALVVGATLAGMTAALAIAARGFRVDLVDRGPALGARARDRALPTSEECVRHEIERIAERVRQSPRLTVHLRSEVVRVDGQMGSFVSELRGEGPTVTVKHGVIVVDTEASEHAAIPLHADGFCPRAHTRLLPTELSGEGLFAAAAAGPDPVALAASQAATIAEQAGRILSQKDVSLGVQCARVDPYRCISCMTCIRVCPYGAAVVGEHSRAEIRPESCAGCGSCAADCPAHAITLPRHTDAELSAAITTLAGVEAPLGSREEASPEQTGIAPPRWRTG